MQICDRIKQPVIISMIGNMSTVLALVLLGIPAAGAVSSVHVRLILHITGFFFGTGFSFVVVSTFPRVFSYATEYSGNIGNYLFLTGS